MRIYVKNKSLKEFTEIASGIENVRNEFSVEEAICELKKMMRKIYFHI